MSGKISLGRILAVMLLLILVASCAAPAAPAASPTAASAPKSAPVATPAEKPAQPPAASGQMDKVRVGVLQGTQMFPIYVMQKQGIDKKYNLNIERKDTIDANALYTMLRGKEADIGFGGWTTAAEYRTKGSDMVAIYSMMTVQDDVMVKKDSPLKSFADLKGKRVGIFGGPAGTTTMIFRVEVSKFFGFNIEQDATVQYGAPPMLMGLLDKGELDAVLLLDPYVAKMLASGKYRSIGELGDIWQQKMSFPLVSINMLSNDEFVNKNPQTAKNFIKAWKESLEYMKSHPELWPEMTKAMDMTSPDEINILRERVDNSMFARWDDELIQQQTKFSDLAVEVGGQDVLPFIPKETFSTKFVP